MDGKAVGERGEARRHPQLRADHRAAMVGGNAALHEELVGNLRLVRGRAREREADAIEDRALAQVRDVGGQGPPVAAPRQSRGRSWERGGAAPSVRSAARSAWVTT